MPRSPGSLRLLHLIASMDPARGGPIEGVLQLKAALDHQNVTVEIACCDGPDAPWIPQASGNHALGPGVGTYGYSRRLRKWLDANVPRFDAVIINGLWQYTGLA